MFRRLVPAIATACAVLAAGCSKDTPPELSRPAKLVVVSGDNQTASGAVAVAQPLVVKALDPKERPVAGVVISWAATLGGGSTTATSTTDAQGQASGQWTLGPTPGVQQVVATSSAVTNVRAVFTATNVVPTALAIVSGDEQVGDAGAALGAPLVVRVTDVTGAPVAGASVAWVGSSGGSFSPVTSTSDATGSASTTWTLANAPGPQTATASTAGPPVTRAVFRASNGATISGGVTVAQGSLFTIGNGPAAALASSSSRSSARSIVQRHSLSAAAAANRARPRRLIVEFKPAAAGATSNVVLSPSAVDMSLHAMRASLVPFQNAGLVASPEFSPVIFATRVTVPDGTNVDDAAAALRNDPAVASVTLDSLVPMLEDYTATEYTPPVKFSPTTAAIGGAVAGRLPNDPLLTSQFWHYTMVDAMRVWATNTGSNTVLVAVVDNGIRFDHPAIAANLTNDGYNFVSAGNRLNVPQPFCTGGGTTQLAEAGIGPDPTAPDDVFQSINTSGALCIAHSTTGNHGLHVAGTIGAAGNDNVGGTGINWTVRIRPVRVLDITGSGSFFDVAQGVLYAAGLAASNGAGGTITAPSRANVINMSLGGGQSSVMQSAAVAVTNAGSLIIASAGNSSSSSPSYPAALPEVLSVVALGPDLQLASYTNVGTTVSISAPGGSTRFGSSAGVFSSTWNFQTSVANYAYYQGTSMAAPHVVGIAALVLAANPGMTGAQLRARLQSTAVDLGPPGRDNIYGYGLANAYNAVNNVAGPTRATIVRLVNATTGTVVRSTPLRADGSYAFSRLTAGTYFVYAGQDEGNDQLTGMPGRRWGWYGGAGAPMPITLTTSGNALASVSIGLPVEAEPNNTIALANRLVMNSYITGVIALPDNADVYSIQITAPGTYYFETTGLAGSCGFGIELDTVLDLLDSNGATIITNDDTTFPSSLYCSSIARTLQPGTYYLRVSAFIGSSGQYRLWVRDVP